MKLLACTECMKLIALTRHEVRRCKCGMSGGYYNEDGDTATVWGPSRLLGLSNFAIVAALRGHKLSDRDGDKVLWLYDESNGKITRHDKEPADAQATGR